MFIGTSQNSQIVKSQQTVGQLIWKCPKSSISLSLQTTSFPCSYHVTQNFIRDIPKFESWKIPVLCSLHKLHHLGLGHLCQPFSFSLCPIKQNKTPKVEGQIWKSYEIIKQGQVQILIFGTKGISPYRQVSPTVYTLDIISPTKKAVTAIGLWDVKVGNLYKPLFTTGWYWVGVDPSHSISGAFLLDNGMQGLMSHLR